MFAPIRATRASSDVIVQIRRAIFSGQYRPGDRLPTEREMAQQFGVSRVTVRDALRALEANGLIRVKVGGQGGPYVSEPDISRVTDSIGTHLQLRGTTFEELAEARQALETTAAHLAAERATNEDLEALQAAIEDPEQPTLVDSATSSLDFHMAMVMAAHNRALLAMFSAASDLIQQALDALHAQQPDMRESSRKTHRRLYDAIAARDGELAERLMREHLDGFAARVARFYAEQEA